MWEAVYTVTPTRGYFDPAEMALVERGIRFELIHGIEFVSDGSVAIVYEIDGSEERLHDLLDTSDDRLVDYTVRGDSGCTGLVAQIRFFPDEMLERLFSIHQSFGVSIQFPIRYLDNDPATVEVTEVGPQDQLRRRITETRDVASVEVTRLTPYEPEREPLFEDLTDRQQEVLLAAIENGYYRNPRDATLEDIADDLSCSSSTVGQHLRRIEDHLVSGVVPEADVGDAVRSRGR